jgi:hypothetical protein
MDSVVMRVAGVLIVTGLVFCFFYWPVGVLFDLPSFAAYPYMCLGFCVAFTAWAAVAYWIEARALRRLRKP